MVAFANHDDNNNVPSPQVQEWCRNLVRVIKHGGMWGIPRSGVVFEIDQTNKRLILKTGDPDNPDVHATRHNFSYIGWDVIDAIESSG